MVADKPLGQSRLEARNRVAAPIQAKLESAAIKAEPIRETKASTADDLRPRSIAILKAKNHPSTDDAKMVEEAAKMAQKELSGEVRQRTSHHPRLRGGRYRRGCSLRGGTPIRRAVNAGSDAFDKGASSSYFKLCALLASKT